MKKLLSTALFLFLVAALMAQVQSGLVRRLNSNKSPIPGVYIKFEDAKGDISDTQGKFVLRFEGKKPGQLLFKKEIFKDGYELVNEKDFELIKLSDTDQLGVDVILAEAGTVDAAKKEYYNVSEEALLAGFNREKKELRD
ncbi:MAG: hypothetical protein KDC44_11950, partial [Phaeodactylibacter sp.]|nr:hypothetical protein [Phaeodactylibacter sp.]